MTNPFKNLFKRSTPVTPYCPPNTRIYCIGDIHGRDDLLLQLHEKILDHANQYTGTKTIIYLGDYIDRGEHSNRVIELLISKPLPGFQHIYLRGNHEQTLLDFLIEAEVGRSWFNYGGLQTLVSYGVRYSKLPTSKQDLQDLQDDLRERIPAEHINFMENTRLFHVAGSYYFVHAGVSPRIALDQQSPDEQLWIRDAFIQHTRPYEKIIVHGHTITDEPDFQPNRIGLDTGAYLSGKLSCLVLENETQHVIQT
jgi:serine/threonine protein phosphatase 1